MPPTAKDPERPASWYCQNDRHVDCRDKSASLALVTEGITTKAVPCQCSCHGSMRTPKHDWADEKWADEIDLEKAIAQVPPLWLLGAVAACTPGVVADAAWHYLGEWESRSATARFGRISCLRCAPTIETLAGSHARVLCKQYDDPGSGRTARAGRCLVCGWFFWFWVQP